MTVLLGGATYSYDEAMGHYVNDKHRRVAEVITDIDPELVVLWEPGRRNYALAHLPEGSSEPYIITTFEEDQMGPQIIEVVLNAKANASGKNGTLSERVERADAARRLAELKETEEIIEQERDKARFLWMTPKHQVKMDGKVFNL